MLTGSLIVVVAVAGFIAILSMVQLFLAVRQDHELAAAPRYVSLEALDAKIQEKKDTATDLEDDLQQRRKDIATIADVQAEVVALEGKLDNLNLEWGQIEERRNEVSLVRGEIEEALNDKLNLENDLGRSREEYKHVQERLEKAEQLFAERDAMLEEKAQLELVLVAMREEHRELVDAKANLERQEARAAELLEEISRFEARSSEAERQSEELSTREKAEREKLGETQAELTLNVAKITGARQSVFDMEEKCSALEARKARLADEIGEGSSNDGESIEDRLEELRTPIPVLTSLKGWRVRDTQAERDALQGLSTRIEQSGLQYHRRTLNAFHTAMKVNQTTQMAVLAGISGTGKSQLPRQYALGMGIGFLQVPVQPRWDSPQDLMGFYNYIEKRFRPTDMARALYQLDMINNKNSDYDDRMLLILLDEMNLARVEYYFSDFLSRLESRPTEGLLSDVNLRKDAEIELEIPMPKGVAAPRIFPGYNLLFAGTMNEDESTQSLSEKVMDRANMLRFAAPDKIHSDIQTTDLPEPEALRKSNWDKWIRPASDVKNNSQVTEALESMVQLMKDFNRPFGHRLGNSILAYVANYPEREGQNAVLFPLADQVEMRLLPKLRGIEMDQAEPVFEELREFVSTKLRDEQLAEAIEHSIASARDGGTGQFVWSGVTRR
jgi:hypothetical protein